MPQLNSTIELNPKPITTHCCQVIKMPSDKIRRRPPRWDLPLLDGNPDYTCSAYDNCSTPWGSTHQETWPIIKKHDFLSGMFIWTGFDYLGEPTPYPWLARSSYFGIVDLADFPKDSYYFYQSEWTNKPVLHIFPHWNWSAGDTIDVWAYTNFDDVELFVNGASFGVKQKTDKVCQLVWRVPFAPGVLKAIGRAEGQPSLAREIKTAGKPDRIILDADRDRIQADGHELSFITVKVVDAEGTLAPRADNLINFEIQGEGKLSASTTDCKPAMSRLKQITAKRFMACASWLSSRAEKREAFP